MCDEIAERKALQLHDFVLDGNCQPQEITVDNIKEYQLTDLALPLIGYETRFSSEHWQSRLTQIREKY